MSKVKVTKREKYLKEKQNEFKTRAIVNAFNIGVSSLIIVGLEIVRFKFGPEASDGFKTMAYGVIEPTVAVAGVISIVDAVKSLVALGYLQGIVDADKIGIDLKGGRK